MTTTAEIKNGIEKTIGNLTPAELASYITEGQMQIIARQVAGEDVTGEDERIEQIFNKYVLSLNWPDYSRFWVAMWIEERKHFAQYFLEIVIPALDRERSLTMLLVIAEYRAWYSIEGKKDAKSEDRRKMIVEHLAGYLTRYKAIDKEIQAVLEDDIWEREGIPRPVFPKDDNLAWIIEEAEEIVNNPCSDDNK